MYLDANFLVVTVFVIRGTIVDHQESVGIPGGKMFPGVLESMTAL